MPLVVTPHHLAMVMAAVQLRLRHHHLASALGRTVASLRLHRLTLPLTRLLLAVAVVALPALPLPWQVPSPSANQKSSAAWQS